MSFINTPYHKHRMSPLAAPVALSLPLMNRTIVKNGRWQVPKTYRGSLCRTAWLPSVMAPTCV